LTTVSLTTPFPEFVRTRRTSPFRTITTLLLRRVYVAKVLINGVVFIRCFLNLLRAANVGTRLLVVAYPVGQRA
jgi:hypothetical protein